MKKNGWHDMSDLWSYGSFLNFQNNKYIDGAGNNAGIMYAGDMMYECGVRIFILTPQFYYQDGRQHNLRRVKAAKETAELMRERYPGAAVYTGSRVRYYRGVFSSGNDEPVITIGNSRYVLLEFEQDASVRFIRDGVEEAFKRGYRVIIENIFMYDSMRDTDDVKELMEYGAYFLMNISAMPHRLSKSKQRFIESLILGKCIHLISTDKTNMDTGLLNKAETALQKLCGEERCRVMMYENYINILNDSLLE